MVEYNDSIKKECDILLSKGLSNGDISRILINKFKLPITVEVFRHFVKRRRNAAKTITQQYNYNTVLVVMDLHCPWEMSGYFEHCVEVYKNYECNRVVFIGDEVDGHSISFHQHNANLPGPIDELKLSIKALSRWHTQFPNADVLLGNHSNLVLRQIANSGLPSSVVRTMNEIYKTPTWNYKEELTIDDVLYIHGTGITEKMLEKKVMYTGKSVVMGHWHSISQIKWYTNKLFGLIGGCGCNEKELAFEYNKSNPKPSIVSCAVVENGIPILIPM